MTETSVAATTEPTTTAEPAVTTSQTTAGTTRPTPSPAPTTAATTAAPDTTSDIHKNALVIDTHNDTTLKIINEDTWLPQTNIAGKTSFMVDIPKLRSGGIDVSAFAAYTKGYAISGGGQNFARANSRTLALINCVQWTLAKNPDSTRQVRGIGDLDSSSSSGKIGILSSIEGAYGLSDENGIELLRQYHDLGVLLLAPVWSNSNALGEGVNDKYPDNSASSGGLTSLGHDVIAEMNRLGMVIDVSHMNDDTFWETVEASSAPIIASHSSVFNLCNTARNLEDSQIRAIAAGGGVIQVNFHRPFLAADADSANVDTLVNHIDYIVDLVGIDYVGLGSDFDGATMPQGLTDASMYPSITRELVSRGYSETDISKILGGNADRVFRQVWGMAAATGSGAPDIQPALVMGEPVPSAMPTLSAKVQSDSGIDIASMKIIVDGIAYSPSYDESSSTMSLTMPAALVEKFHVVTFVVSSTGGVAGRAARIFYVP